MPDVRGAGRRRQIRTVEGLANGDELHPLQQAFIEHHGLQCGFCTPGFLMLAAGVLEREPGHQRRGPARCAVVQSLPLHRLREHRQGRPRRRRQDGALADDQPATTNGSASRSSGWRTRRWSPAAAASPATSISRTSFTCAIVRSNHAHGRIVVDRHRGGARAARRGRGVDRGRHCRRAADRFPRGPDRAARAVPPAGAGDGQGALRRRAGGGGVRRGSLCRRGRRRSRHHGDRGAAGRCSTPRRARRVLVRPQHRSRRCSTRATATSMRRSTRRRIVVELELDDRPAFRRAAGDARRDRPLRRLARHAGTARRRQGAAPEPASCSRACSSRRRRRCSATKSHVGGGFGIRGELYPEDVLVCVAAMRFGRPVKWIEDRREHLIAANHSRQQHHHIRAAVDRRGRHPRHRRRDLSRPGRLCAHPRRRASRTMTCGMLPGPVPRAGAYRAVGHFRLTNKTPAATYRAPGRFETHVRARAAGRRHRAPSSARSRSRCGGATPIAVDEMPYQAAARGARRGDPLRFRRLCRAARQARWRMSTGTSSTPSSARRRADGEAGRRRACDVRREERASGPADGVRIQVDTSGAVEVITGGASIGQGFETVMAQVCAETLGVDYRRSARHPRPDRPHRARHRRARLARHGDDGVGHAQRGAEGARQGARHGGRADAGAGRRARHRRRQGGAQGSRRPGRR